MVYGYSSLGKESRISLHLNTKPILDRARFGLELENAVERREEVERELNQRGDYHPQNNMNRQRLSGLQRLTDDQLRMRRSHCIANEEAIRNMSRRCDEQRRIMGEGIDRQLLLEAMKTFGDNLEQVRLMRCEDAIESGWHRFVSSDPGLAEERKSLRWSRACERSAKTLLGAFSESGFHPPRLSGRALDPQVSLLLTNSLNTTAPILHPKRLKCIELQFDDRANLDEEMLGLSNFFQQGFNAAVNVQGLHIGFTRPVSIPFESVFHEVQWQHLRYIGFGAWRLNSEDIIGFVRRHKTTLKAIRLRGVLLNEGSRWLDVLKVLRLESKLRWASFRGVGYTAQEPLGAVYVPEDEFDYDSDESEDFPGTDSDIVTSSDEEGEIDDNGGSEGSEQNIESGEEDGGEGHGQEQHHGYEDDSEASENHEEEWDNEDAHSNTDDDTAGSTVGRDGSESEWRATINDHVPDDMEQHTDPPPPPPNPGHQPNCDCGRGYAWGDLMKYDDNERNPPSDMWKWWQDWVIKRCPLHDPAASVLP
jgi:hypothetical protein